MKIYSSEYKLKKLHNDIYNCKRCNFDHGFKPFVSGAINQKFMLIGQSPPSDCDSPGYIPFYRHKKLFQWLEGAGIKEK